MLFSVFLLYLIGSACAVRQNVDYFAGRSASIVIQSTSDAIGTSAVMLYGEQFHNNNLKSIEDVSVADLLAHVMGTQPFNTYANRKDFPQGNMFNKAKGALLITLDSVSPDLLDTENFQRVELATSSYPANTLSMVASMATGTSASSHGIVGEHWVTSSGERVKAYEGASGASLTPNIADLLSQEWNGASLAVSASASSSLAAAFAVNKHLAGANSYSIVVGSEDAAGVLVLNDVVYQAILQDPSFHHLLGGVTYSNNKITITDSGLTFDLESEADAPLFAEFASLYNFVAAMESDESFSSLVADEIPDFFAFSFASLKGIQQHYGAESPEYSAAIVMVNNFIRYAVFRIDRLYGGRAVSVVASLNTNTVTSAAAKATALSLARNYISEADFELYYPSIYTTSTDSSKLCGELKSNMDTSATVECFSPTLYGLQGVYVGVGNSTGNHTAKKPLNVPAFWITFWIAIILVLFVLAGIFFLMSAGIEAANDSLLFRSTGRHLHQS